MKLAGTVIAHRGKRLSVAQCDAGQLPPLYASVCDAEKRPIGKIVDLYGSVSKPYVTILCDGEASKSLVNQKLYVIPETKPERKARQQERNLKKHGI
ncbi:MAG TPA: Gar1/Naf1 family protein [Methanocorpusculum sp.]|nr:Gar1/Naf1 family protein [Methanocorpusculum sp.]